MSERDTRMMGNDELSAFLEELKGNSFQAVPEDARSGLVSAFEELDKAWAEDQDNELIAADTAADMAWKDFEAFLNGMVNYPVINISAAISEVKYVFDQYDDPTDLPYEKEYEVLGLLIHALEAIPENIRKDSLAEPMIEQLKQRWIEFMDLFKVCEHTNKIMNFVAIKEAKSKVNREIDNIMKLSSTEKIQDFSIKLDDFLYKPITKQAKARTNKLSD